LKVRLAAAVALTTMAISSLARAADLEPRPPEPRHDLASPRPISYNRTGFYGGIVGGGALASSSHTFVDGTLDTGDFNVRGGLLGATVGFAYQAGPWVLALENDLEWTPVNGSVSVTGATFSTRLQWLDNFRARVGYAFDRFAPYIAFGPSFGGLKTNEPIPGIGPASNRENRSGWTVGAGLEYSVTPNLTAKVEYLFVCLGANTQFALDNVDFMGHFVRAGLNYRFGWFDLNETDSGMPVKAAGAAAAYRWTGLYVGSVSGGSAGTRTTAYSFAGVPIQTITNITNGGFRGVGFHFLTGIEAGYNWQIEHYLLGFESDFQLTQLVGQGINSRRSVTIAGTAGTLDSVVKMPLLGTFRGRLGVTADRWLFYATGGFAYGEIQTNSKISVPGVGTVTSATETTPLGWTAGGGFEGALWGSWTSKFEYLYIDLGKSRESFTGVGSLGPIAATSHVAEHIVRVGLNTRFNWYGAGL
jgi:outer membrane immunogenic protein